jgi:hypothetical protein
VRQDLLLPLDYTHGGSVFVPRAVSCGGTAPLVIMLHGNNTSADKHPSLGGGRNLDKLVAKYINGGLIYPVILAEPVHHGTCSPAAQRGNLSPVFGGKFSFEVYRTKLLGLLRTRGIRPRHVSVVAHSGAGCCPGAGIFAATKAFPNLFLYGTSDTCYGAGHYASFPATQFAATSTRVVNACRGPDGYSGYEAYEKALLGDGRRPFPCDKTYYQRCVRHPRKPWFSFVTKPSTVKSHNQVFTEFVKSVLFKFFKRSAKR